MAWMGAIAAASAAANNNDEDEYGNRTGEPLGIIFGIFGMAGLGLLFFFLYEGNILQSTSWIMITIILIALIVIPMKIAVIRTRNRTRYRRMTLVNTPAREEFVSPRVVEQRRPIHSLKYCISCGNQISQDALQAYRNGHSIFCQSCGQRLEPDS